MLHLLDVMQRSYSERWMSSIKYYLPITRFTSEYCHKVMLIVEHAIFLKLGFKRHIPKAVLYGSQHYRETELMNARTE